MTPGAVAITAIVAPFPVYTSITLNLHLRNLRGALPPLMKGDAETIDTDKFAALAVEHLAKDLNPILASWFAPTQLAENLRTSLSVDLVRAVDAELAAGFSGACPVGGAVPADYMNRFARYSGGTALLGTRFKGLDITKPFVDVVATSAIGSSTNGFCMPPRSIMNTALAKTSRTSSSISTKARSSRCSSAEGGQESSPDIGR